MANVTVDNIVRHWTTTFNGKTKHNFLVKVTPTWVAPGINGATSSDGWVELKAGVSIEIGCFKLED